MGINVDDYGHDDSMKTALGSIRLWAEELCRRFRKHSSTRTTIRSHSGDIIIRHLPQGVIRNGPSAGVSVFLALLRLSFKVGIKRRIAATGAITLRGEVWGVGGMAARVRAALKYGAKLVIVPGTNKIEAEKELTTGELQNVAFVDHIIQLMSLAVIGTYINHY